MENANDGLKQVLHLLLRATHLKPQGEGMRIVVCAIALAISLMVPVAARRAAAESVPACNRQVMTRHGNEITIGLEQLGNIFNQNLKAAHSQFSDLRLTAEDGNKLRVSGENNGTPVEISGPLQPGDDGAVRLHADEIKQNGDGEKGLMMLSGKTLADFANFQNNDSLSSRGNDIFIYPDPLLNVSGQVTGVSLDGSSVTLTFTSQPCK